MHNIKSNFDKIVQPIKSLKLNCFDENGNIPKPGIPSLFTDLQELSLALTAECMSLDSENWLFNKIKSDYSSDVPKLTDRTRYNRRKRPLFPVMEIIRQTLATRFLNFETYFMVDSMPLEVCKLSREKRKVVDRHLKMLQIKDTSLLKRLISMDIHYKVAVRLMEYFTLSN